MSVLRTEPTHDLIFMVMVCTEPFTLLERAGNKKLVHSVTQSLNSSLSFEFTVALLFV